MNKQEHEALRLCVESLDQLLPYLAKVPADVGLLNDALVAARPLLEQELAPANDERECCCPKIGEPWNPEKHGRDCPAHQAKRPAQTEQQPVATWMGTDWNAQQQLIAHLCKLEPGTDLYAAPIAQTEQQPVAWARQCDLTETREKFARLQPYRRPGYDVPLYAAPVAQTEQQPVEVMPFQFKHPDTGDAHAVALTRQEVADGMEDTLYEKLADLICHCEPVAEAERVRAIVPDGKITNIKWQAVQER